MARPTSTLVWPKHRREIKTIHVVTAAFGVKHVVPDALVRASLAGSSNMGWTAEGGCPHVDDFDSRLRNPAPNVLILASRYEIRRVNLCLFRPAVVANGPRIAHAQPISPGLHRRPTSHAARQVRPGHRAITGIVCQGPRLEGATPRTRHRILQKGRLHKSDGFAQSRHRARSARQRSRPVARTLLLPKRPPGRCYPVARKSPNLVPAFQR